MDSANAYQTPENRAVESYVQTTAEIKAVLEFVALADELGLDVPPVDHNIKPKSARHRLDLFEPEEAFGFAQHHGIPTRLLDWTRKPRYAAFFAADRAANERARKTRPDALAVWCFDRRALAYCPHLKTLTCKRSRHNFLHAQDGLFLWYRQAHEFYMQNERWPVLEETVEEQYRSYKDRYKPPLRRLLLPSSQADELLTLLWRERISRAHLMPTFDNVATAAPWKREADRSKG